jgi:hypothetical protein
MGFWLAKTQQPFFHDFKRVFHDFTHGGAASHPSDKDPGMASPVDEGFRTLVFYLPVCANGGKFSAKGIGAFPGLRIETWATHYKRAPLSCKLRLLC